MEVSATERERQQASENGNGRPRSGERDAAEAIIEDVAMGPGRALPGVAGLKFAGKLATRPHKLVRRGAGLAAELGKVAVGRSELEPEKGDRRFKDKAWQNNPAFRRLLQAYLAAGHTVDEVISDTELDWKSERRVRFSAENALDALAPSNSPLLNPTVLKATIDSGGLHFLKGLRNLAGDIRPPFLPSSVDKSGFEVGEDLASTPGSVVLKTEVFELLQYHPKTDQVREVPLLCVPPMINKYYVVDLAEGKSMLEWAVKQGQQVFTISWRNPGAEQADWNLDTYLEAVVEALDAVEAITGAGPRPCAGPVRRRNPLGDRRRPAGRAGRGRPDRGPGAGRQRAGHREVRRRHGAPGRRRRGHRHGRVGAPGLPQRRQPGRAVRLAAPQRHGLGLLGQQLPAGPGPAGLGRPLLEQPTRPTCPRRCTATSCRLARENSLTKPGRLTALGGPVDLSKITADSYLVAGIADHISPVGERLPDDPAARLRAPLRALHLRARGGDGQPAGRRQGQLQVSTPPTRPTPRRWLRDSSTQEGSWWPDWTEWLGERSGDDVDAPVEAGARPDYPVLDEAPGEYVKAEA